MRAFFVVLFLAIGWGHTAAAGPILDRVKAEGVVHCGSAERPGLATVAGDQWRGLNVDVCRAVAAAVLGSPDRIEFHEYETPKQYDGVRLGTDDLFFLTAGEINEQELAGKVLPGPTVFVETHNVMVPRDSKIRHLKDLAGQTICFMLRTSAEHSLRGYLGNRPWIAMGYSEDGEMMDAYNVHRCGAVAYEITTLLPLLGQKGALGFANRILPEPLVAFPVMATTGTDDGAWSAIVAWTVHTLVSGERPETHWYYGGARAMPVAAPELGLDNGWQARVLSAVGHYGQIYERHLGKRSGLVLARGLNANQVEGGLLLSPFLE